MPAPTRSAAPDQAPPIPTDRIDALLRRHDEHDRPRYERLWSYYRNELPVHSARRVTSATAWRAAHRPAQAMGLPERFSRPLETSGEPREIVIENDIAWRIDSIVDFVFGRPYELRSRAAQPELVADIERTLGSAGLIAAIWFIERRHSEVRDKQLTESHQRILEQRTHVDALMEVVRENTRAITALEASQRTLADKLTPAPSLGATG